MHTHTHTLSNAHTNSRRDKVISCPPPSPPLRVWMAECWNKTRASSLKPDTLRGGYSSEWRAEKIKHTFNWDSHKLRDTRTETTEELLRSLINRFIWFIDTLVYVSVCVIRLPSLKEEVWLQFYRSYEESVCHYRCLCVSTTHINRKRTNCRLQELTVL